VAHRGHENDRAVTQGMPAAVGNECAADTSEEHQLRDIVEMHESAEVPNSRLDYNVISDDGLAGRKLHWLANGSENHGKAVIVS